MANRYISSVGYAAVATWAASTAYTVGALRRQLATPTYGNDRIFRCTTAGTSSGAAPTWVLTAGGTTADGTVTWTEVTSNATYNSWANPYGSYLACRAHNASTDVVFAASDHTETTSSNSALDVGSASFNITTYLSVNRAGAVPPGAADLLAGARINTTGTATYSIQGRGHIYGLALNVGSGATAANMTINQAGDMTYENCAFNLTTTASASLINLAGGSGVINRFVNCSVSFGAIGQSINALGNNVWRNDDGVPFLTGAIVPTTLVSQGAGVLATEFRGLDLSALGAGKTLVGVGVQAKVMFINCKLNAAVTVAGAPITRPSLGVWLIGCHSAGNSMRNEIYAIGGILTTETTIVRTGAGSDSTTPFSFKLVPNANNRRVRPMETFEGVVMNTVVGVAVTLTVHVLTDGVTLKDDEIQLDVEYLNQSATPISKLVSDGAATQLTAGVNQNVPVSPPTWTTTGITTPVYQTLDVTFTPQMAGHMRWKVRYGKAATTVYVCPKAELS